MASAIWPIAIGRRSTARQGIRCDVISDASVAPATANSGTPTSTNGVSHRSSMTWLRGAQGFFLRRHGRARWKINVALAHSAARQPRHPRDQPHAELSLRPAPAPLPNHFFRRGIENNSPKKGFR
jgi:hypothetical protein